MSDPDDRVPVTLAVALMVGLFMFGLIVGIYVIPSGHDPSVTKTIHDGDMVHCECGP